MATLEKSYSEYDRLLAEAVRLRRYHETRARDFVPRMYAILVEKEGVAPQDAADRIYKDLVGVWEKDTIRRLLPAEAKNPAARARQALRHTHLVSRMGLVLQSGGSRGDGGMFLNGNGDKMTSELERENLRLRKALEELEAEKRRLLERTLRLERLVTQRQRALGKDGVKKNNALMMMTTTMTATKTATTVVLPPHLFLKAYSLMRNSTKPLVLKIKATEVVDIDKMNSNLP